MKNRGIYKIINKINGKFYIGSTINVKTRWTAHKSKLNRNKHGNDYLQNSWNKYGEENFIFKLIREVENKNNLIKIEQFYLDMLKPTDRKIGYNVCKIAGNTMLGRKHTQKTIEKFKGRKHTQETKKKMSENMKGNTNSLGYKHTEKWKKNKSKNMKGNTNSLGRELSEETKKRISLANKGKKRSEETKKKISQSKMGKKLSEETKKKMSESRKGVKRGKYKKK